MLALSLIHVSYLPWTTDRTTILTHFVSLYHFVLVISRNKRQNELKVFDYENFIIGKQKEIIKEGVTNMQEEI